MMDPSNALLQALIRIVLLCQLVFYRSVLGILRFLKEHRTVLRIVTWVSVLGPYLLFGVLIFLITNELIEWWRTE